MINASPLFTMVLPTRPMVPFVSTFQAPPLLSVRTPMAAGRRVSPCKETGVTWPLCAIKEEVEPAFNNASVAKTGIRNRSNRIGSIRRGFIYFDQKANK